MNNEELYGICERVQKYLDSNNLWADVYPHGGGLPVIDVEIHWGDWKHDHLRMKYLMGEAGATLISTHVTEENGSDCYSAVHHFFADEDLLKEVA